MEEGRLNPVWGYTVIFSQILRKTAINFRQNIRSCFRDFNLGQTEYKGVLTAWLLDRYFRRGVKRSLSH
jgi:hypothetical protein